MSNRFTEFSSDERRALFTGLTQLAHQCRVSLRVARINGDRETAQRLVTQRVTVGELVRELRKAIGKRKLSVPAPLVGPNGPL